MNAEPDPFDDAGAAPSLVCRARGPHILVLMRPHLFVTETWSAKISFLVIPRSCMGIGCRRGPTCVKSTEGRLPGLRAIRPGIIAPPSTILSGWVPGSGPTPLSSQIYTSCPAAGAKISVHSIRCNARGTATPTGQSQSDATLFSCLTPSIPPLPLSFLQIFCPRGEGLITCTATLVRGTILRS